jgi:hypothetical protein
LEIRYFQNSNFFSSCSNWNLYSLDIIAFPYRTCLKYVIFMPVLYQTVHVLLEEGDKSCTHWIIIYTISVIEAGFSINCKFWMTLQNVYCSTHFPPPPISLFPVIHPYMKIIDISNYSVTWYLVMPCASDSDLSRI